MVAQTEPLAKPRPVATQTGQRFLPSRQRFLIVDPLVERLDLRLAQASRLGRSLRSAARLGLAALLGFGAMFLIGTLLDAFVRWPGR